jgi:hypothetical protein
MQRYFHQTHFKSFQRQLHIYGFNRFSAGLDKGSYYHPMFVRGKETASLRMTRCKIKGSLTKVEVAEPNFYDRAEPVGSAVVNMACLDQSRSDHLGLHAESGSLFFLSTGLSGMVSSTSCADTVLSKVVSLSTLRFSGARPSLETQEQPILRHNVSCDSVTPKTHRMMLRDEIPAQSNMMFGGNANQAVAAMILQDDFQTFPLSRIVQNRRMSLLEEGDEAFFAGKKFFFVESHPRCQNVRGTIDRRMLHTRRSGHKHERNKTKPVSVLYSNKSVVWFGGEDHRLDYSELRGGPTRLCKRLFKVDE